MTMETDDTPSVCTGTLAALRALAAEPPVSITNALRATDAQAQLLVDLMTPAYHQPLLGRHASLIPSVIVETIDDLPVPGTAFWAKRCWHIHIRASDPIDTQNFTVLHELKHIIDYPLRRKQPDRLSDSDWETLADHFAGRMLARESSHNAWDVGSANKPQAGQWPTTKTGGAS